MATDVMTLETFVVSDDLPQPVAVRDRALFGGPSGLQALWRFANGYGASVINGWASFGVEIAVIRYYGEGVDDFHIDYENPITGGDVLGWLTSPETLIEALREIRALEG